MDHERTSRWTRLEAQLADIQSGLNRIDRTAALQPPRLQTDDIQTLRHLQRNGPERVGVLAEFLGTSRASMSARLGRLEDLGLVTRERPYGDRRAVTAGITEAGVERVTDTITARLHALAVIDPVPDVNELAKLLVTWSPGLSNDNVA